MKIAILSDSPTLITGFARNARNLSQLLHSSGHEVICFGIGAWGKYENNFLPFEIWTTGDLSDNHSNKFIQFIAVTKPDLILIHYDLLTTLSWIEQIFNSGIRIKILSYLVIDGLPVFPSILKPLNLCTAVLVPLECVANLLKQYINVPVDVLPHFVDENEFCYDETIRTAKSEIFKSNLLIGVFAQNRPRKQITQIIQATKLLNEENYNCKLLINTDYKNAGWRGGDNLANIIFYYKLEKHCILIEKNEMSSVINERPYDIVKPLTDESLSDFLRKATVPQKVNLCDVIVVASAYGGFEYSILEGQSCKIPVCSTVDNGIMSEVSNGSTVPLLPSLYDFTNYGAKSFRIAPSTIAGAITQIATNPSYKEKVISEGFENAKKYFIKENWSDAVHLLNSYLNI